MTLLARVAPAQAVVARVGTLPIARPAEGSQLWLGQGNKGGAEWEVRN